MSKNAAITQNLMHKMEVEGRKEVTSFQTSHTATENSGSCLNNIETTMMGFSIS